MSKKLKDVGAVVASRLSMQLVGLIVTPLAARVMTKEELGAWALILILTGFGATLADAGLPAYVVRERDWTPVRRASVLWLSLAVGAVVTAILLLLAGPLCAMMGISDSKPALLIATVSLIPSVAASVLHAELRKQLKFNSMLVVDVSSSVLLLIVVGLGLNYGYGIYSYAWAALVTAFAQFALGIKLTGSFGLMISWSALKDVANYSAGLVGFNAINYWARRLDQMLVNRFVGVAAVAQYSVAYRLMMLPITQINSLLQVVLMPYMAPHQNDHVKMRRMLGTALQMIGLIITPPMTFLWLARSPVIRIYLGPGWDPAAELLGIFALIGILQAFINPLGIIYQVSGQTRRFFVVGVINTAVVALSFVVGISWGIRGVAIAYLWANLVMLYPLVTTAYRIMGAGFREWLNFVWPFGLIPPISLLMKMLLASALVRDMELMSSAAAVTVTSLVIYATMFRPTIRSIWSEVSPFVRRSVDTAPGV